MELTQEQVEFAADCMAEWIRIREDNDYGCPNAADVDHSSLLRRLLSGKKALDKPPPLRFSYPDYGLAEGEPTQIHEIHELPETFQEVAIGKVSVDQHPRWNWHDKDKEILVYVPTGDLYQLTREWKDAITTKEPFKYEAKILTKIQ